MKTLGLETTGDLGSVALVESGRVIAEASIDRGMRHGRELVARARALLEERGLAPRDLGLVAVSRGPGSFTGVRIGVLAAKSLAWTLGRPLAGVPTFEALAAGSGAERAGVVIDARIRQVYFTLLRREDGRWRAELPDQVAPPADAAARLPAGITLVGTALRTWPDAFPRTRFVWAPEETWEPRAAVVARLGEERFRREGRGDDVLGLEPYYLRALAVRTMEEGVSGLEA